MARVYVGERVRDAEATERANNYEPDKCAQLIDHFLPGIHSRRTIMRACIDKVVNGVIDVVGDMCDKLNLQTKVLGRMGDE